MEESNEGTTIHDQETENLTSGSHVLCATYPISQSLAHRLQLAVEFNQLYATNANKSLTLSSTTQLPLVELNNTFDALSGLIGNCIEALDALYFSSSNIVRQHGSFQHRLCIRIATNPAEQTLTITDLGIGMTRSDLINCLGIGRSVASNADDVMMVTNVTDSIPQYTGTDDEDDEDDDDTGPTSDDDDGDDDDSKDSSDEIPEKASVGTDSTAFDDDMDDEVDDDVNDDDDGDEDYIDHAVRPNNKIEKDGTYEKKETRNFTRNKNTPEKSTLQAPLRNNRQKIATSHGQRGDRKKSPAVSCTSTVLGGFYAALCTLGIGVTVRTKSKFDEYYEFEIVGQPIVDDHNKSSPDEMATQSATTAEKLEEESSVNDNVSSSPNKKSLIYKYETFQIKRPYSEGIDLTVENGFTQFEQVRGDSGTSIEIKLNDKAIEAGLLNEQEVLKPLFLKIVETTQYTVAFSTDTIDAQKIIQASVLEAQALNGIQQQQERDELMDQNQDGLTTNMEADNDTMDLASLEDTEMESAAHEYINPQVTKRGNMTDLTSVLGRAKYIPARLSLGERKMLRLVEATMNCCDYTTQVDQDFGNSSQSNSKSQRNAAARRTHEQLRGVTAILNGVVTACDYNAGQKLTKDHNFVDYSSFFQNMFEIARRHKIMNPEKMRTEYGKMVYLLQDAIMPVIQQQLSFNIKGPIFTVYRFLEERNGIALLEDPQIERATEEILAGPGRTRSKIDQDIRLKERAVQYLKKKYKTSNLSSEDIHLCLYSICDNNSFLNSNRVPIDKILNYLTKYFSPTSIEDGYSLSILSGTDGARLTHNHERQYNFAYQSLTLWKYIINDMFYLWSVAEDDLLNSSIQYTLQNTGQGMQRIQPSPNTYKAMQQILRRVQNHIANTTTNKWIGSSVIHMGDHNVPNALSFIDKYTQVPRILGPIVTCLEVLEQLCEKDDGIKKMINTGFGGFEKLRKDILYDFFKSAFDGSGADNFYDAGSCIDGRLTSAWNWCSQLPEKQYYPIFKLTGFIGFDGEFQ